MKHPLRWQFGCSCFIPVDTLYIVAVMRKGCYENKKLSYCWETVRRESMPRIAEMDVEMTT